ncbi:LysR family transcriptional regulator [Herbaspirillum sp. BH-1]|uniref:LysR family transcriptional regulator n=1 Tax=Herbaspirillum TaxID=963 RepID=UPI000C87ED56|nr:MULTISPECIES: LysR family transcriptional regulator [Herbaspirillum]MCI1013145.1 LysR family transcriptional regulator [Herbaspirillum sp. C7C2]PLY60675.1 LysR family transcriptional regulator [Herbaspirillum sp. BH-1]QNB07832.1 LysR family transcriptional regulator [Herbaspirillum frisingense]UIN19511.1 LysR family transcriptional regulator [Herbaspirillum frisingense]HZG21332.1 LysR family transcriptional regulator [Herbaspirillum sp.]
MSLLDHVDFSDLRVFVTILRTGSFKAAAIQLGLTPSATSHAMKRLEERLSTRLLYRSSRAVSPTAAGSELALRLEEGFEKIGAALGVLESAAAGSLGELRINVFADAAHLLIEPAIPEFVRQCPKVKLTVVVDDRPIDIVSEGYDAGIRYGHYVPEGMVTAPLTRAHRWVAAASPDYLQRCGRPQTLEDLAQHNCLQLLLGDNSSYKWEFGRGKHQQRIRVPGLVTINNTAATIAAARAGVGIAYLLEARIRKDIEEGALEVLLPEWAAPSEPFHMYYSSRRHAHPALRKLIDIIRLQHGLARLR